MGKTNITAIRLDAITHQMLIDLIHDCAFSKSHVIRQAIRLMKELSDIKKQAGKVLLKTEKGDSVLVFL